MRSSRLQSPYKLDFESTNKLFNPVQWQRKPDGTLIKASQLARNRGRQPSRNITPLYLVLTLDSVETNGLAPRYVIGVERQAAPVAAMRRKQQRYVSVG